MQMVVICDHYDILGRLQSFAPMALAPPTMFFQLFMIDLSLLVMFPLTVAICQFWAKPK